MLSKLVTRSAASKLFTSYAASSATKASKSVHLKKSFITLQRFTYSSRVPVEQSGELKHIDSKGFSDQKNRDLRETKLSTLITELSNLPEYADDKQEFVAAADKVGDRTLTLVAGFSSDKLISRLSLPPNVSDALEQFTQYEKHLFPKNDVKKALQWFNSAFPRQGSRYTLTASYVGYNWPMVGRDGTVKELLQIVYDRYKNFSTHLQNEKENNLIPFVGSVPGSGKSKLNQEMVSSLQRLCSAESPLYQPLQQCASVLIT